MNTKDKFSKKQTLCWDCKRATSSKSGCRWVSDFKPVKGWKAERVILAERSPHEKPVKTYTVIKCPLFIEG